MSDTIKLSPKHGLNPTIPVCFFCGEEKNEIAILGRINRQDDEVPMHACIDYEPCDKCKENMAKGITMIGVSTTPLPDKRPPIQTDKATGTKLYPTGSYAVVTEEAVSRILSPNAPEELKTDIFKKRIMLMEEECLQKILQESGGESDV